MDVLRELVEEDVTDEEIKTVIETTEAIKQVAENEVEDLEELKVFLKMFESTAEKMIEE